MKRLATARASVLLVPGALLATSALAKPPQAPRPAPHPAPHPAPPAPPPPLAMLPSVARVRIAVHDKQLVVTQEVNLPRGDWRGEPLDLYVAFGAPGAPRAIDAHLVPVADGSLEPEDEDAGEAVPTDRAPRRPVSAHPLLGRDAMAGVVVHLKKDALERALAPGNMAALRLRSVVDAPEDDPLGGKSVLVRLGASRGTPLTLGRIVLSGKGVARAEARLCGEAADPHPLAVSISPRPRGASTASGSPSATSAGEPVIAPVLAVRRATDDLCVRYWL